MWFSFAISDAFEAVKSLTFEDILFPVFLLFWIGLLSIPLKHIDRRDFLTGITYSLVMTVGGFIFIFGLPAWVFTQYESKPSDWVLSFIVLTAGAAIRWNYGLRGKRLTIVQANEANAAEAGAANKK